MASKKGSRTIHLPDELDKQIRLIAAEDRVPVSRIIEAAVTKWLELREQSSVKG